MLFGILTGLVSYFSVKKRKFRKIVEGEPILVIQNGKILENNLRKVRYSTDELNLLLRDKGVFSPEDVEYGLLEINGKLSIMKKTDKKTVTCGDLGILKNADTLSTEVIIGGQIIYENLRERKLSGKDLMRMLKPFGIRRISEVHYATLDENNKIYIDKYDDKINPKIDISENNDNV
ncbi:hypothetical protein L21TH_0549 [Caldisalinibacter kiritimatiensis]|uniref:YetF C-terminal domain-containing protein n=2 Tax=Caldisalinibacter kiritimatiensis TaxID=1304284 RepID=R1AVW2_9FIRM|nr:hypothetical protein L21TH_0549 [Caldisalinibacter kiritimatiensis]